MDAEADVEESHFSDVESTTSPPSNEGAAELRADCNGHSSPDSGVTDMVEDQVASTSPDSHDRFEQKVTIMPNAALNIKIGDSFRRIEGQCLPPSPLPLVQPVKRDETTPNSCYTIVGVGCRLNHY